MGSDLISSGSDNMTLFGIFGKGQGTTSIGPGIPDNGGFGSLQLAGGAVPPVVDGDGISATIRTYSYGAQPSSEIIANVFTTANADYAEYFEWEDGNVNSEDRVGYFVRLKDDKVKINTESNTRAVAAQI